jgi:uncharacterized protein
VRPFSLLVKPASADCNLTCDYCFYLEKAGLYPGTTRHRMSVEVLERMIRRFFAIQQPSYGFGWQGGEPTLMGREFFEHVTTLQERHAPRGATVSNGVQTNAVLIDDAFARHLARYNFLLGVSLDGPAELHDAYRTYRSGRGSHADVLRGIDTLRRHGVEFNILTLVSRANVSEPQRVYRYLRELGVDYLQFIPCVEFDATGAPAPFAISGDEWGVFLNGIFDEWAFGDVGRVSIRNFDGVLSMLLDGVPTMCTMGSNCRKYFVVEHNGDVYPCDFFVQPDLRLGNVLEDDFLSLWRSERYRAFGLQKKHRNELCEQCDYLRFCAGDCIKHRLGAGGATSAEQGDPRQLSHLCAGWKAFYDHTLDEFRAIARSIDHQRRGSAGGAGSGSPAAFEYGSS